MAFAVGAMYGEGTIEKKCFENSIESPGSTRKENLSHKARGANGSATGSSDCNSRGLQKFRWIPQKAHRTLRAGLPR